MARRATSRAMQTTTRPKVIVIGSGFGGLEADYFTSGRPFHAGASWAVMEAGVKMMAGVFSD